jgi:Predicted NTPase (NACHT family)
MIIDIIKATLAKELIKFTIKKLLDTQWFVNIENSREILSLLLDDSYLKKYIDNNIIQILLMRTIIQPNTDIFIDEIYSPLPLLGYIDEKITLNDLIISNKRNINIIGLVGQGKSTLLRKIFLEEITKGNRFPIFIQLRKLNNTTIVEHIVKTLNETGVKTNNRQVIDLLMSRKVVLLLDGFDEVKSNHRGNLLDEIRCVKNQYNCFIITTSRPNTELCYEPSFNNVLIDKLSKKEILSITEKINKKTDTKEIIRFIENNEEIEKILSTPILVTLFNICHPFLKTPPKDAIDFYKNIFETLIVRHQKIQNVSRDMESNLTSNQLLNIFCTLCYCAVITERFDFTLDELISLVEESISFEIADTKISEFITNDILNITNLITMEGYNRYVFLHKSIPEFHAALFISKQRIEKKEVIYKTLLKIALCEDRMDNVLCYLMNLDTDCFNQFVILDLIELYDIKLDNINNLVKTIVNETFQKKFISLEEKHKTDIDNDIIISVKKVDAIITPQLTQLIQLITKNSRETSYPFDLWHNLENINPQSIRKITYKEINNDSHKELHIKTDDYLIHFNIIEKLIHHNKNIIIDFASKMKNLPTKKINNSIALFNAIKNI